MIKTLIHTIEIKYLDVTVKDSSGPEAMPNKMVMHYTIHKEHGSESSGSVEMPVPDELHKSLESILKEGIKKLIEG
jgi:hypothetical protein